MVFCDTHRSMKTDHEFGVQVGKLMIYYDCLVCAVVRTKAISAKIDQPQRRVVVSTTIHRTFGKPQWQQLHDQLQVKF